jgi:hypothetical protein
MAMGDDGGRWWQKLVMTTSDNEGMEEGEKSEVK